MLAAVIVADEVEAKVFLTSVVVLIKRISIEVEVITIDIEDIEVKVLALPFQMSNHQTTKAKRIGRQVQVQDTVQGKVQDEAQAQVLAQV
jgi:hypothetical protein